MPYARRRLDASEEGDSDPALLEVCARAADAPWPRAGGTAPGVWSTQVRLIDRAMAIVGCDVAGDGDAWAMWTGVSLALTARARRTRGYRDRAAAVLAVAAGRSLEELLVGGHVAGCWGLPWRWERAPQRLRCLVPDPLRRPIASTTSGPRAPPSPG